MDLGLQGAIALVTAASRGIGAAVADRLAREGMTVVATSRTVGAPTIRGGGGVLPRAHDLGDAAATETLVADVVAEHARLDVLVLNTPGPPITPVLDTTWAAWEAAHDLLLRPVVQLALAGARQMKEQGGGVIVLLTSTWVVQPATGGVLSAAYRAAASAFAKTLAAEVAPYGVRVVHVMPGATGTDRMQSIVAAKSAKNSTSVEDEIAAVVRDIPLGRWAEAEEIADAVAFLASRRAAFITGATLAVDGGAIRSVN
ncbi:SDR family oxidoreductase [Nocardioides sp. AN3]